MDNCSKSGLALDDSVRDTHLTAQGREENNELNWVNIVGDEDQRGLLVLNQTNNVVEPILDGIWLLAHILLLLTAFDSSGLLVETLLLFSLGLWSVLVEELERLGSGVAVEGVLELGDRRRDLQAKVEDLLLALKTDILGPLDHAREVSLGLDVLTDAVVAWALLDQRVLKNTLAYFTLRKLVERVN